MNRLLSSFLIFGVSLQGFGLSPSEELELLNGKNSFLPLWSKATVIPAHAALVGGKLYYTASDEKCPGKGLFGVDPRTGEETVVAKAEALPCVQGIQEFQGKLLIQHREAEAAPDAKGFLSGTQFSIWDETESVRPVKNAFPLLSNFRGDLFFLLHALGDKIYAPKQGAVIRKQYMAERGLLFQRGKVATLAVLLAGPKGGVDFHPMIATLPLLEKSAKPNVGAILEWDGKAELTEMVVGTNERFYFLRKESATGKSFLDEVDIDQPKRTQSYPIELAGANGAPVSASSPRFLISLHHGLLIVDSTSLPGTVRKSLYFSFGDNTFHEVGLASRDVLGVSAVPDGFLIARRAGMFWHGRELSSLSQSAAWLALNSTPNPKGPCGSLSVIEAPDKTLKIYHSQSVGTSALTEKIPLSEWEEILLGVFRGVSSEGLTKGNAAWYCDKGALYILAQRFDPNLNQGHLEVLLETETRNGTDAPSAVSLAQKKGIFLGSDPGSLGIVSGETGKALLFVISEASLTLAREAGSETRFDGIRKNKESPGQVDIFLKGDREELFYKLQVSRTGRDLRGVGIPALPEQGMP